MIVTLCEPWFTVAHICVQTAFVLLCWTFVLFQSSADALQFDGLFHFQHSSVFFQVKPVELTHFLQVKKSEGYCIVGVEQTANSQKLQDFKFPEKTLLLLG